jgi:peptidoglycan hydrolase CwlO-like protein
MIRSLIKWALIALIAIIAYNYFFGNEQEKQQSQSIIEGVGDIGVAAYHLIQDEIQKAKDGKYDEVVQKIQSAIDELRGQGKDSSDELDQLQKELDAAKEKIKSAVKDTSKEASKEKSIKEDLSDILKHIKELDGGN